MRQRTLLWVVVLLACPATTHADDFIWDGQFDGNWDTSVLGNPGPPASFITNWTPDDIPTGVPELPDDDDVVVFLNANPFPIINLNGNRNVQRVVFSGALDYTLTGDTLTLVTGDITSTGIANHHITSDIDLSASAEWDIDGTSSLTVSAVVSGTNLFSVSGTGTLNIAGGGHVSNMGGSIGEASDSTGKVTVTGTDGSDQPSTWETRGSLFVGRAGNGTLSIEAGGLVSSVTGLLGFIENSTGNVTVTGTDGSGNPSTWDNNGDLEVALFGNGMLNVQAGAQMSNTGQVIIAGENESVGVATVSGTDSSGRPSTWEIGGNLSVGKRSDGTLNVEAGGLVTVGGTTTVGTDGEVNLEGGRFEFGQTSLAEFVKFKGVSGSLAGDVPIAGFNDVASLLDSTSISAVDVSEVSLVNSGALFGNGVLAVGVTNTAAGEIEVITAERMRFLGSSNTNAGQVTLTGGQLRFTQGFTNQAGGVVVGHGGLRADGGTTNDGTMAFGATASVIGDVTNSAAGLITSSGGTTMFFDDVINDGEIRTNANSFTVYFGAYSGNGDTGIGTVIMEGDLKPGSSPGTMVFGGDLSFGPTAGLEIEIGGLLAGSEYDQVTVANLVSLGGTLEVQLIDGFLPTLNDTFEIITAIGSVNGMFNTTADELPALDPGLAWNINYGANNVVLAIVAAALAGDYNDDGIVDAADYTVWRDNLGASAGTLPNDADGGPIGQAQYNTWIANFGATTGNGTAAIAAVPEPGTGTLLLMTLLMIIIAPRTAQRLR